MFELEKSTAEQSETIKKLINKMGTDGAIPLDNVTGSILRRVIKYCRMHTSAADEADNVRNGTKSCGLPEHQRVAGFDVSEGGTHDLREDDRGDA
ncbi:SKP1-like protein 3 [Linum grandiflorum]